MAVTLNVAQLTPLQKLDYVLARLTTQRGYEVIEQELVADAILNVDAQNLKLLVMKLSEDMYIDILSGNALVMYKELSANVLVRRNFNGDFHLSTGGYVGDEAERTNSKVLAAEQVRRSERNERLLVRWTAAVAIGAIGLVLWEAYRYFFGHPE